MFGAILSRDEVFENIVGHCATLKLPWALELSTETTEDQKIEGSSVDKSSVAGDETKVETETSDIDSQNQFA